MSVDAMRAAVADLIASGRDAFLADDAWDAVRDTRLADFWAKHLNALHRETRLPATWPPVYQNQNRRLGAV
jgi:hypothetical protein